MHYDNIDKGIFGIHPSKKEATTFGCLHIVASGSQLTLFLFSFPRPLP